VTTLITGAGGLLGAHLVASAAMRGRVVAVDRRPWWGDTPAESRNGDLLEPGWIEAIIAEVAPTTIVHCAAMVDVDGCEEDPGLAERLNGVLTKRVARSAPPGCLVVYISTDGLFDGTRPWSTEATLPCPRTVYGRSKLRGEWEVQLATQDHLLLRTNFFGWSSGRKRSSAEWLFQALVRAEPVTMFEDFFFTPLYVVDFVERLWALVDRRARGIVHVGGADRLSKHAFAIAMAETAGLSTRAVRRGRIADAPLVADRPHDMSLATVRPELLSGMTPPSCLAGLRRFVADRGTSLAVRLAAAP
jgi:dTDP-4-dehydrorhamnose reductase